MADKRPITTPSALAELPNTDSLIAGASAVLSEQGSSPATPPSGFGVVYAKTDGKLYFKNDAGTETDLTATGGGGTDPIIREYTANDTWTKPTAANFWGVMVVCIGAGGGGGSGRRGATSTARGAGSGGGGGAIVTRIMRSATLANSSYSITIGTGGNGGAAITVDNTNGNNGAVGGNTSFGSLVSARGSSAGTGGSTGNTGGANGGSISQCVPSFGPYSQGGASGGGGNVSSSGQSGTSGLSGNACPGGGGAGGIQSNNTMQTGGPGGGIYDAGSLIAGGSAGTTTSDARNAGNGSDNIANNILYDINNTVTNAPGTGGGGGGSGDLSGTQAGGNGGNGGKGAGGGGGGGSTNGANSGAGGKGGDGLCFVVEYYGA